MKECVKCSYKSPKVKEIYGKTLCDFCAYFAPEDKDKFEEYVVEKVNAREIQTYRKQGVIGGIRQKRGMKKKAIEGFVVSRAPFGYKIEKGKLIKAQNYDLVQEMYEEFLNTNLSLNRIAKKRGLSVNGLKKILTNFTYLGKIRFDGEVHEGTHEPLISSTLFNHVQDKLEKLKIKIKN